MAMARNASIWLLLLALTTGWQPSVLSAASGYAGETLDASGAGNHSSVAAPVSVVAKIQGHQPIDAAIDPLTDEHRLRLRLERPGITLWRSVPWNDVQWVTIGGYRLSGPQFKLLVERYRAEHPRRYAAEHPAGYVAEHRLSGIPEAHGAPSKTIVMRGVARALPGQPQSAPDALPPHHPTPNRPSARVGYLKLDAAVANWDADPEVDGLLIRIQPTNDSGDTLPVAGLLEVEVIGRETGVLRPAQPFVRIGYWSQPVRLDDFGPDGAVYRIPFQQVHPEFQRQYAPHAAVLARLSVPSMGVFTATADTVRIRPFSPVRDKLQQLTGQRFFPEEHTADGRR